MLAQARWSPGEVVLVDAAGRDARFADLDALTREVLGESVPVEAWFDWLRGRPWPGAPSTPQAAAPAFEQLGWRVDLARFAEGWIAATRDSAGAGRHACASASTVADAMTIARSTTCRRRPSSTCSCTSSAGAPTATTCCSRCSC